jgi:diguanylate cyclase (GGDEF)-like protein/PAS domain S-box-containing protein
MTNSLERKDLPAPAVFTTGQRTRRSVALMVSVFAVILAILAGLAVVGINLQSSVRAYVGGEGLWSKAQKDAVFDLDRYLSYGDDAAFGRFQHLLSVPLGDRRAREELEKAEPDLQAASTGFLEGRNHPGDVEGMIRLFRRFRWMPEMDRAIVIWTQGDILIGEIRSLGERIRTASAAGPLDASQRDAFASELQRLNARATILEDDFSATLGIAARRVSSLLVGAIVGIGLILAGTGAFVARRVAGLLARGESELLSSERRFRELFERSPAGLYRASLDGRLLACNSALARLLGYASKADVLQLSAGDLFADPAARQSFLAHLHEQRIVVNQEVCLKQRDGLPLWALLNESLLPGDRDGEHVMEGSLIDITDRKLAEEINQHRASHDSLTDLPNRTLFNDRLDVAIHQARRREQLVAVMYLDLDHFKTVNDRYGHPAGDEVLVQAGRRLTSCLRGEDTVARLGGDEFILLLSGGRSKTTDIAAMAQKVLGAFDRPFSVQDRELSVSASIGIALFPNDGENADALLVNADAALYRAKQSGRNNFQFFTAATPTAAPSAPLLAPE